MNLTRNVKILDLLKNINKKLVYNKTWVTRQ